MNTNSNIRITLLLLLCTAVSYAQNRPVRDKIKTLKVAFITERLDLTSEEAQVFWPIYNEHENTLETIKRKERLEIRAQLQDFDRLSEKEADALLDDLIAMENKKQTSNTAFLEKMSRAIGSKKTFLLIKAEEDFKKRLLQEMRNRRRGGG